MTALALAAARPQRNKYDEILEKYYIEIYFVNLRWRFVCSLSISGRTGTAEKG